MRVAASNEKADLERDQLDVALQFALPGSEKPAGEHLFRCETLRGGRWFSEWDYWCDRTRTAIVYPAGSLRFSQLEQVLPAAIEGDGVAMGVLPPFLQVLRDGRLCTPFGRRAVAYRGDFSQPLTLAPRGSTAIPSPA